MTASYSSSGIGKQIKGDRMNELIGMMGEMPSSLALSAIVLDKLHK
jgi:hypothetical protein